MNEDQEVVLLKLYSAAKNDRWDLCREGVGDLLVDAGCFDVIRIIMKQARRFLDDFSHSHPNDQDIDRVAQAFSQIKSSDDFTDQAQVIDTDLKRYWAQPGVSNFRTGLRLISTLQQADDHSAEYRNTVVDIFSTIVVAICTQNWAFLNFDVWDRMLEAEDANVFSIAWSDPKSIELRKSLWTEIAIDLGSTLQTG